MKVLILNGSPRKNGNTAVALREMEEIFTQEGVETETILVGNKPIRGCIACGSCARTGKCAFDDIVNEIAPKFEASDGLVVASPVYYASANATLIALLDRLFYSTGFDKTMKVGACVATARRGGIHLRRAQQIFHHLRHARGLQPVLERHTRHRPRRGGAGRGGPADHAGPGPEHGLPYEEHCPGEGEVRPSREGALPADELHPLMSGQ